MESFRKSSNNMDVYTEENYDEEYFLSPEAIKLNQSGLNYLKENIRNLEEITSNNVSLEGGWYGFTFEQM